jgi:hypothetical protein
LARRCDAVDPAGAWHVFLLRNPFTTAAEYVLSRERGLNVFLEPPELP